MVAPFQIRSVKTIRTHDSSKIEQAWQQMRFHFRSFLPLLTEVKFYHSQ